MSESVKIGGIGKNPAIDKINTVNSMEARDYAAKRMEKLLGKKQYAEVPLHFPIEKIETRQEGKDRGEEHGVEEIKSAKGKIGASYTGGIQRDR